MPLYDFVCPACGATFEDMADSTETKRPCPICSQEATRRPSIGRAYRVDAPWLESVTRVVEKNSGKPHVEAFLANPNRTTYRAWMRGEGLRPQDPGEGRRAGPDLAPVRRDVLERFQARHGAL